jgi:tripeptidyl-peptidase I
LLTLLGDACDSAVVPECILAKYKIPAGDTSTAPNPNNRMGIFEDLGDIYNQTNLNLFYSTLYPSIPQGFGPKLEAVDALANITNNSPLTDGPESDLDFEISSFIIYPQGWVLFQTDDQPTETNYQYEGFLNNLLYALDGSYCNVAGKDDTVDPPYPDPSNAPGSYKGSLQCGAYKPTNVISVSYGGVENTLDLSAAYQKR